MSKLSFTVLSLIMVLFSFPLKAASADTKTILAFGDSLTAGYRLPRAQAFPAQLETALRDIGYDVRVINAGVSGETTAGGLERLTFTLIQNPDYVIVSLGANDMLRHIDHALVEKNLRGILDILKTKDIPVLFCGMKAFSSSDPKDNKFQNIYDRLAKDYQVVYYPFFLEGVALDPTLNQDDGLHPTADGVAVIVKNILPYIKELLKE